MGYNKLNSYGIDILIKIMGLLEFEKGFFFINLVDFDVFYGYCCDFYGYCDCFYEFDECFLEIILVMCDKDLFLIIVDYGNDLIYVGIDYIREYIFFLVYSLFFIGNGFILVGYFVDILVIVVDNFGVDIVMIGESFL